MSHKFSFRFFGDPVYSHKRARLFFSELKGLGMGRKFGKKILFCFKDYLYDHSLYAMMFFLARNYSDINFIGFYPAERPRENPGLSLAKFVKAVERYKPDIIFTYEKILSPAEIDYVLRAGIKLVTGTCGFTSFDYGGMNQSESVDQLCRHSLYLVPHAPHISRLGAFGINAVEFPFWFEPDWFHPLDIEKRYDILFVGDFVTPLNKNRIELLELLSKTYKIAVASDRKPEAEDIVYLGSTSDPSILNRWLNHSKLVIGSDKLADLSVFNDAADRVFLYSDEFFIRQRTYLTMGSGACYFVENHEDVARKFINGQEIVLWENYQDLLDKIEYYLKNEGERRWISSNSVAALMREHSVSVRANQFLGLLLGL